MSTFSPLSGLPATLLMTLRARAEEHGRTDALLQDPQAAAWYQQVAPQVAQNPLFSSAYTPVFQLGTAVRAHLYDALTTQFCQTHPHPLIVELGAGLSTRYHRLNQGNGRWVELDLPPAIAFRRILETETADHTFLSASLTDPHWPHLLPPTPPENILFIAEGVLFFLTPTHIDTLSQLLRHHFPGATFAFDVLGEGYNPALRTLFAAADAPMHWFLGNLADLLSLGWRLQQEWVVTHHALERWQTLGFSRQRLLASRGNQICLTLIQGGQAG